jgi:hypothetical protein
MEEKEEHKGQAKRIHRDNDGKLPAVIMLGAIACVGFSSPASACSSKVLEKLGEQQWSMGPSSQEPLYSSGSQKAWGELREGVAEERSPDKMEEESGSLQRMNQVIKRGASASPEETALGLQFLALAVVSWMMAALMSALMAGVVFATAIAIWLVITKVLGTQFSGSAGGEWISAPQQPANVPGRCKSRINPGGSCIADRDST